MVLALCDVGLRVIGLEILVRPEPELWSCSPQALD